ncbi:uncharacterized protein LOC119830887 [Zerene cesonia]|uniref:uncharacterized protein LOC119830887 n=1 Tax=Zerene cesonia TaxID=33412 RepID=UPI0018E53DF7|nr:uncharacterized protein LOC119830887 [Zerene cesonia]
MYVGGCLFLITIVASCSTFSFAENLPPKEREKRHILPLLGFLEGYKIGQNFALQLPPYVLSPIFVLPPFNQLHSVHIHESNSDDSYDENGGTVQIISPAKLVLEDSNKAHNNTNDEAAEELGNDCDKDSSEGDTFRQNTAENNTTLEITNENSLGTTESTDSTTVTDSLDANETTLDLGPYPTAIYKNDGVNTVTFTETPIHNNLMLPSLENDWQNFCSENSTDQNNYIEENIESRSDASWHNAVIYPTQPSNYNSYNQYPYYPTNNHVENSYNPEGPDLEYSKIDPWQTSGKYQLTSQFRPLAGLYYDGYLQQQTIKNTGFVPYNNNYYQYK